MITVRSKIINTVDEVLKENFNYVPLYKSINIADELIKRGITLKEQEKPETTFSSKQHTVLGWWKDISLQKDKNGIILDGAIQSGKSTSQGFSFFMWAMSNFKNNDFVICGKTISSLKRNIINPIRPMLDENDWVGILANMDGYIELAAYYNENLDYNIESLV